MRLTYQLVPEDLVAFNLQHAQQSQLYRRQLQRYRLYYPIAFVVLAAVLALLRDFIVPGALVVVAVAWHLFSPGWLARSYRAHIQQRVAENVGDALREPAVLELCDDGIHSTGYLGHAVYHYAAVEQIVDTATHTFIYLGKGMAFILPKDRVPNEQAQAFLAELRERLAVTGG